MSLRRRLALAVVAWAVLTLLAGMAVLGVQRAYVIGQLDDEILALSQNPRAVLSLGNRAGSGVRPDTGLLADVYIGRVSPRGVLTTVLAPTADPDLVPALAPGERVPTPAGRASASGSSPRVRVVTADLSGGAIAVFAVPTADAEAATRRLAMSLLLAGGCLAAVLLLVLWWVDRLGLRPIAAMTRAADEITAGATDRRVPDAAPGTEAARLGQALNTMIDATTAAERRMRQFVADASHELRTPLTTVRGYAALHASSDGAPVPPERLSDAADAFRRIGAEAARMSRLVDALLDLSDLDEHGIRRREAVDLAVVVADAAADLRVIDPDRSIGLEVPAAAGAAVVGGDHDRLTQVVLALGANALRHTPAATPLWLTCNATVDRVRVEVADAGPGIPDEHKARVFDRFHRVDGSRASSSGGSGLGLAVVAAVVTAHGGRYGVSDRAGSGSVFWFEVPSITHP